MNEYIALLLGLAFACVGGELFTRGSVGIARWARIPSSIVGATLAAAATSSPELSVSVISAFEGRPDMALGAAVGSNVVNIGAILGLGLLITAMRAPRADMARDYPAALLQPAALGLLAFDGRLTRLDGLILLVLFGLWVSVAVADARRHRESVTAQMMQEQVSPVPAVVSSIVGLAMLIIAGRLVVTGGTAIAESLGVGEFVIGATIVAIGTSLPELATTIIASLRGHQDIALGTILGSNIFNGLFIVGIATAIFPFNVALFGVMSGLLAGILTTALVFPPTNGVLSRARGVMLIAFYVVYVVFLAQTRSAL